MLPGGHRLDLQPLLVLDKRDEAVLVARPAVLPELAVLDAENKFCENLTIRRSNPAREKCVHVHRD